MQSGMETQVTKFQQKAAWVSWNPSTSEFIANEEDEGAKSLGRGAS